MKSCHIVVDIRFRQAGFCPVAGGVSLECPRADIPPRLASASKPRCEAFVISPGGAGIHWHFIDEDLLIDGLLGTNPKPPTQTNGRQA